MRKRFLFLFVPLAVAGAAADGILESALASPPELAADVIIRLASSPRIAARERKVELLEQAFQLAGRAAHPYKTYVAAKVKSPEDTDAGALAAALDHQLSRLDLQARAVRALLPLDRARARSLFESIPLPAPGRISCREPSVPRVDEYYRALAEIFDKGFTAAERRDGKHIQLIQSHLSALGSPVQLEPAARLLTRLNLPSADYASLASAYASALKTADADPRTFSATASPLLTAPVIELANRCPHAGCSPLPILDALRTYLARHMKSTACADRDPSLLKEAVKALNDAVIRLDDPANPRVPLLTEEDQRPERLGDSATVRSFWSEPVSKALADEFLERAFGAGLPGLESSTPRPPRDAETENRDYIARMESWQADHKEDDRTYFHEAAALYTELLSDTPPGPLRNYLLSAAVSLLRDTPVLASSPPEWHLHFNRLLRRAQADFAGEARRSGSPAMLAYLDLEATPHK